ncbi:MAG TPA: thioredoxin domain-containing protein [Lacisediminihabitans sp.]|nr:thioredoxin domain-containing protein [Lacisediminihabitans sp.]HXD61081.1 thioredoxin domain-containing protein [Lacisediminihabitans sp.]
MQAIFFASAFCEPCMITRAALAEAARLVPAAKIAELDIVRDAKEAERAGIRSTPTVIVCTDDGDEVFRAEGVPTVNQVLTAFAKAV